MRKKLGCLATLLAIIFLFCACENPDLNGGGEQKHSDIFGKEYSSVETCVADFSVKDIAVPNIEGMTFETFKGNEQGVKGNTFSIYNHAFPSFDAYTTYVGSGSVASAPTKFGTDASFTAWIESTEGINKEQPSPYRGMSVYDVTASLEHADKNFYFLDVWSGVDRSLADFPVNETMFTAQKVSDIFVQTKQWENVRNREIWSSNIACVTMASEYSYDNGFATENRLVVTLLDNSEDALLVVCTGVMIFTDGKSLYILYTTMFSAYFERTSEAVAEEKRIAFYDKVFPYAKTVIEYQRQGMVFPS